MSSPLLSFSRKIWIYFLQEKSEVYITFQNFKALVENEIGKKIKTLRTIRGDEYYSTKFEVFCVNHGIQR